MKHMVTHAPFQSRNKNRGKKYTCYFCNKNFSRQKFLSEHRKNHKDQDGNLPCPKCEKKYFSYTDMAKHMHQVHDAGPVYECLQCDWKNKNKQLYNKVVTLMAF